MKKVNEDFVCYYCKTEMWEENDVGYSCTITDAVGWRGGVIVSAPSTSPSPTLYLNGNKSKSDERGTKNSII